MVLQNIQIIRDAASYGELVGSDDALTRPENQSITLVTDNMKIYNNARDVFIWDDVNSLLNILRLNTNINQYDKPMILETFEYESIMYMRMNSTQSNIDNILELIN
ncbi:MAG: hypothetical protein M0P49_04425 [Bacilli bacterium]|nr:hypothetical protein [Bacilli bacterium]